MSTIHILAALALVTGAAVSFLITPATARLARALGIMDLPCDSNDAHKSHASPTPYLGGVAIFSGVVLGSLFLFRVPNLPLAALAAAVTSALLLGLIGLLDDVKPQASALRFGAQVVAAGTAYAIGFQVQLFGSDLLNAALTVFWIVGITNSFNLLDNMDGLSAGLAGISATSFLVMALVEGLPALPILAATLAGSSFGFLAHNRHPAKVFMGDAGSTFLGFLLALIGMRLRFDNLLEVTFLVPVVALGVPILDTTIVVLSRLRHRRPVFTGARDHLSHRLVRIGLPVKAAVGILYFWSACLGWLGLVISQATPQVGWMLLTAVIAIGIFFGTLLWNVPVYPEDGAVSELSDDAVDPDELSRPPEDPEDQTSKI